jgi:hypothetical protein
VVELESFLQPLLVVAGVLLQFFVRQFKGMPEWSYHLMAVALASGAYLLVHDYPHDRLGVIRYILWMSGGVTSIWGGTFITSSAAKGLVGAGANPENAAIPLTSSK